jgi:zinc/manganese transport system permease protein
VHVLLEPGFFANQPVRNALILGVIVSVVSSVTGIFTVIRSQSFAGHALADVATTGGTGASLFGISTLGGFVGGAMLGAGTMEALGVQKSRRRDVATGIVLGAATGLSALFLYLNATSSASTGVAQQVLFGSIFTISSSTIPIAAVTGVAVLFVTSFIWRPLMLSSVSPEIAAANGIALRATGFAFMLSMAIAVGLSSIVIGSILSTALLVGPAATALRITRTVRASVIVSCLIGTLSTWLGVLLAYDSFYWDSSSQGLPVSFFIVAIIFVFFLLSGMPVLRRRARSAKLTMVSKNASLSLNAIESAR